MNRMLSTLLTACLTLLVSWPAVTVAQTRKRDQAGRTGAAARKTSPGKTGAPAVSQTPPTSPPRSATTPLAPAPVETGENCGCEGKPLPDLLAVVNGVEIRKNDLSPSTQQKVNELQQEVVEARKRQLDLMINAKLLEAEAKKRGVSSTKLLEQEVVVKAKEPTAAEAQAFYDQNREKLSGEFKDVKDQVIAHLRDERQGEESKKLVDRLRAGAQVRRLVPVVTPPSSAAERARVLAEVNGERITSGAVEDSLRPLVNQVQEQVYELRRAAVELKINDTLLEQEAKKRKVAMRALLETEVSAKVPVVTEAHAQTFYNENKDRITGDFAQVKYQIIQYLQERESEKAQTTFAEQLRRTASVQIFLTPPELAALDIAIDDQPAKGNPAAKVTIIEFTDFQCPSCAQTQPIIERLAHEYADRVLLVARDFPLNHHAQAFKAAEAAEAAREQGKYWEYAAMLFNNQSSLEVPKLKEYATRLGLDRQKFDAALDTGRFSEKVQRDMQEGLRAGVNATPTLFINGRHIKDRSYEGLKAAIEAALKSKSLNN